MKKTFLVSAMMGIMAGSAWISAAPAPAWAAEPATASADTADLLAAATRAAEAAKANKAASSAASSSSSGIDLPGAPPTLTNNPAELERAAEEASLRAAADEAKRSEDHNRKSYEKAYMGLLPLSSDQIRGFLHRLENTQGAAQAPSGGPPKGEVKFTSLSLDPGKEPASINLDAGYVTTLDLVDQTGEPWPILDVGVGGNFEVTPTQAGSHVVRIVPLTRVGTGNLSIILKDLSTPIIFRLNAGGPTFHMRYDARVPKLGPNAKMPLIQRPRGGLVAGDQTIAMILENAPPKEAKRVKIGGLDARTMAWRMGERVFVRTPLTLLSPAWNASASSADGTTVYEIGDAPVLLMSDNGALIRARILREEDHDK